VIVLFLAGIAAIVAFVFSAMKSNDVYREAVSRAKNHPEVQSLLGTPIEEGWLVTGKVDLDNRDGEADIRIPIHGPKDRGVIHAVGRKENGVWRYTTLEVEVEGKGTVNLLEPPTASHRVSIGTDPRAA
jgi:hypothetical protein